MIVNTTKIRVRPDKYREFLQTMKPLLEPIKRAKGCRTFGIYIDAVDKNSSLLMGEWETELDLNNYLHSNDFAILRGAITVLSNDCTESMAIIQSGTRNS